LPKDILTFFRGRKFAERYFDIFFGGQNLAKAIMKHEIFDGKRDVNRFLTREWIKKFNLEALLLRQNFARKHFDIFWGNICR